VKGVFDNIDKLIRKVSEDQGNRAKLEESASISVISHDSQSLEERNTIYMWFQLYIEVILRMHHKISDRKELYELCKTACQGNDSELEIINEFEKNYKSENAIWWYTRESCLYRMLNKALRFQHFDTLFIFRFLITDIAKQIKTEYEKFIRTRKTDQNIIVYRGQSIGNGELELMKNNVGEFLSMNSFFSTTLNRSIAIRFINSLPTDNDVQQRVLFEITINPQLQTKPFANVTNMSSFKREDEILIMLGAFFKIDRIHHDEKNQMWITYLSLADESDYRLKDTFAHMKEKIGEETNLASLGKILFEMGEYDQVDKCYQHMMYHAQFDLSVANSGLSKAALGKQNFTKAAQYEEEALKIKSSILSKNHRDLAISYSRLGDIYCKQNDHSQALQYLKKAMRIQEKLLPSDPLILAKTYNRIAVTSVDLNDYTLALKYYNKALKIRQANLPANDKSIASVYHNIGKLYHKQEQFTQALQYYNDALEIYKLILPPKHPSIIQIEKDIQNLKLQTTLAATTRLTLD
jgi:tetratricopeptide (TPR) repeat protein